MNLKSIAGQMGQAWNELTETAKEEYTKQAKDLKVAYDKEYRSFLEGLSDESIQAIESATGKKLRIPGGKKARKQELNRAAGSPGKPLTAFFEFMNDFREKEAAGEKVTVVAKRAGEKWSSMSDSDKQVSCLVLVLLHWLDTEEEGRDWVLFQVIVYVYRMLTTSTGRISPPTIRPSTTNGTSLNTSRPRGVVGVSVGWNRE
jgi:hypothetical protein